MKVFHHINDWLAFRNSMAINDSLGFVPTMGNLHLGHSSLVTRSKHDNQLTMVSLFINPTQFNNPLDLLHYPKTLEADLSLLEELQVDFCLLPLEKEIYPDEYRYQINETQFSKLLEGDFRPGHFNGVLTVVMKLLNIVKPNTAYFGEKDFQQYLLIKGMVDAFFMPTKIIACPTIRDGQLAFSSRNNRLTHTQKQQAHQFAEIFHQPTKPCSEIHKELQANDIKVDYLMEEGGRRYVAVIIDEVRLIDNYSV